MLFPPITKDWDKVDSTMPQGPDNENLRYRVFTKQHANQCGANTVLAAIIKQNSGRTQIDQSMGPAIQYNLPFPIQALQQIVAFPWGLISQDQ